MITEKFVEQFKALSDATRLKIMRLLSTSETDLCVCEIMDVVEDSHCNISRHLKILKTANLVKEKKQGKWVYFGIVVPEDPFHASILQAVSSLPEENFCSDTRRMKLRLSLREDKKCVDGLSSKKWTKALKMLTPSGGPDGKNKREKLNGKK
ncbi:MAG: metalloregulator ArsR/SmtB family transcription factor [Syntrophales bacterium]|nr:metalloregulator ArsR/SmtB family transcription factor [Syntrophales bacterium]MDD5533199.1 metalloregulator ArsR/SmtB family transcription factor [Syntrophales bacterium]